MSRAAAESWKISDEEHARRVRKAREEIAAHIAAANSRVAEVRVDESGIWHAFDANGQEITRAQTGPGLLAVIPYA